MWRREVRVLVLVRVRGLVLTYDARWSPMRDGPRRAAHGRPLLRCRDRLTAGTLAVWHLTSRLVPYGA